MVSRIKMQLQIPQNVDESHSGQALSLITFGWPTSWSIMGNVVYREFTTLNKITNLRIKTLKLN